MGKINSRQKGAQAERESAALLREYGFEARRGQQFSGGNGSPDVVTNLPLHVEVKRVEAFNLYDAVEQAKRDSGGYNYVILHRKNKKKWQAILDADIFLSLMRELEDLRKERLALEAQVSSTGIVNFYRDTDPEKEASRNALRNLEEKFLQGVTIAPLNEYREVKDDSEAAS